MYCSGECWTRCGDGACSGDVDGVGRACAHAHVMESSVLKDNLICGNACLSSY